MIRVGAKVGVARAETPCTLVERIAEHSDSIAPVTAVLDCSYTLEYRSHMSNLYLDAESRRRADRGLRELQRAVRGSI